MEGKETVVYGTDELCEKIMNDTFVLFSVLEVRTRMYGGVGKAKQVSLIDICQSSLFRITEEHF